MSDYNSITSVLLTDIPIFVILYCKKKTLEIKLNYSTHFNSSFSTFVFS